MKKLYPLKFDPILKKCVWGGNTMGDHIGEAWIVSDMEGAESVVNNGFLAENDLPDILETYLGDLVGDQVFDFYNMQFPVLIKIMDIKDRLSVQVHPNDEIAMERFYSYGKNEFWYITAADPESVIYMGFKKDTTAEEFYNACKEGRAEQLLNAFHPVEGDCFYVEAGIVHSAAGGIKTVEVQQPSDITFRLYDWGRENNPQTRREMHLEDALDCINFNKYDEARYHFRRGAGAVKLVDSGHFVINSLDIPEAVKLSNEQYDSFAIYVCTHGQASVQYAADGATQTCPVKEGEAVLVPASMDEYFIVPEKQGTHLLEVRMPKLTVEEDDYIVEDGRGKN